MYTYIYTHARSNLPFNNNRGYCSFNSITHKKCKIFLPLWFADLYKWFESINNFTKIYKIGDVLSILFRQPPSHNLSLFHHDF